MRPVSRLLLALTSVLLLASAGLGSGIPTAVADERPVGEWPLRPEPVVVERFDPPDNPYGAGHRGVDLLGRPGQQVHAALAGSVSYAGMLAGRGVVVVDHGATRTTYQPVSAGVDVGDAVAAGDPIGRLEVVGSHCLPSACLHWGWIEGETYLDPLELVGGGPVRLLPLWRDRPTGTLPDEPVAPVAPSGTASPYDAWRPLLDVWSFGAG
jgi:murein DD-endopeptidase MepM/ murein hydrolase activator NlpD